MLRPRRRLACKRETRSEGLGEVLDECRYRDMICFGRTGGVEIWWSSCEELGMPYASVQRRVLRAVSC